MSLPVLNLDPENLILEDVDARTTRATVFVRATASEARCPSCNQPSDRVHSRYTRECADLPMHGQAVRIRLRVRRFFCKAPQCPRRVFAERLPFAGAYARTTARLRDAHTQIGLFLGGEAGARLAKRLAVPTSPDTLLRRVKQYPTGPVSNPRIIGIDDWAWCKGQRYGTIVIDLERGRVLDLLPDRESQTLQSWLKAQPQIELISRDRSGTYAQAASTAAPQAKQVADRWHLLKNLRETVERLFGRCYGKIKATLAGPRKSITNESTCPANVGADAEGILKIEPQPSQRRQSKNVRRARRVERFEQVRQLHQDGHSASRIATTMGMARETVRQYLRSESCPDWQPGRTRPVRLDGFRQAIDERLRVGCRNAAELHRELTAQGHRVSYHAVRRFVRRRLLTLGEPRQADQTPIPMTRLPSARQLAFDFIRRPEEREAEEQAQLESIRGASSEIRGALQLAEEFAAMLRKTMDQQLTEWLTKAEQSECAEIRGFARGLRQDEAAVAAAMAEKWSNGPVEGHINRLKAIKRQMYGRAGFELLRARLLHAA